MTIADCLTLTIVLLFSPAISAVSPRIQPKTCKGNGNGKDNLNRKCIDASGFATDQPAGTITQINLGPGHSYACRFNGKSSPGGATHADCTRNNHGRLLQGDGAGDGEMNVITRGTNAEGEDLIFASTNVDGEICHIGPDATATETVVECAPANSFPSGAGSREAAELVFIGSEGSRFRELVADYVDQSEMSNNTVQEVAGSGSLHNRGLQDDLGGTIDTMVVWTEKAECKKSGLPAGCTVTATTENNMRGLIDLAIAETNTAYSLSGIFTELRLVHAYRDSTYTEVSSGNSYDAAMISITGTNDGVMDDVHAKRDAYGADIVAMLIDDPTYCGVAWLGPRRDIMFSVTGWSCATGTYYLAHEVGHNMGCFHDKGTENACSSTDYNYGWRDPQAEFRTILAYDCASNQCDNNAGGGCNVIQRFSNPVYQHNGKAMGDPVHDNARQINEVRATIAAYSQVVPRCTDVNECDDNDSCTVNVCDGVCLFEPIDCDDGNACTADSCSGGNCFNTAINCDDGNSCTEDTCDIFSGCSNTPIQGCCGNGLCEPLEDANSCFDDCAAGPFTVATPLCGSSCWSQDGNMFDIEAKDSDIAITSIKIRIYIGAVAEVWTKSGTHIGFEFSSSGWTKVAEHDFSSVGAWTMAQIPESSFTQIVNVAAGSRQAFYITLRSAGEVMYSPATGSTNTIISEDDHLRIYEGPAKVYQFGGSTTPVAWNGEMIYTKDVTTVTWAPTPAPTTPQPTEIPTASPTDNPSKSPTLEPTTAQPTNAPTPEPTDNPSKSPSLKPTTAQPTKAPTPKPTENPSKSPTLEPTTAQPTNAPTPEPTESPSKSPTLEPTLEPTKAPTPEPTVNPSKSPTLEPTTAQPTEAPTVSPTDNPSKSPTLEPTLEPTKAPTPEPTVNPSKSPTLEPTTAQPTKAPTVSPTDDPSKSPTLEPTTAQPTEAPTAEPTDIPSKSPTLEPTTAQPTKAPTPEPTDNPTRNPSASPTPEPTTPQPTSPVVDCELLGTTREGLLRYRCAYPPEGSP